MHDLKALCLDLDDTLWHLGPVIRRAERETYDWLARHYPRVAEAFSPQEIRELRLSVAADYPGKAHDLASLRRATYGRLARRAGYPPEMAEHAYRFFQAARNRVTLFHDVEPALERLGGALSLYALTNGTADLAAIGIAQHFAGVYSAGDLGAAKPDPGVYARVCDGIGVAPHQVLHAGNDPEHDVAAAARAGMRTAWINRGRKRWPGLEPEPDMVATDLKELAGLLGL